MSLSDILTVEDVEAAYGRSRATIYRYAHQGQWRADRLNALPPTDLGQSMRFSREEVERFARERLRPRLKAAPPPIRVEGLLEEILAVLQRIEERVV
ncbi:MAG: helix-turn-helix domain-containing protein [Cyanobacteria bacterium J06638_7]